MRASHSRCFFLSLVSLLLLPPGSGAADLKPRAVPPPPAAAPPSGSRQGAPGDVIPPCYMVYGYGRDAHGKGPFLDIAGNALPIGQQPSLLQVWRFRSLPLVQPLTKPHQR